MSLWVIGRRGSAKEGKSGGRGGQVGAVEVNQMQDYDRESRGVILSWERGCSLVE